MQKNTINNLIKESASEEKILSLMKEWFTTHYDFDDRTELVKDILDWHTKQMEKAYDKGREQNNRDLELWLLRLHNEPELWTVAQALKNLTQT